ncbi:helix-turn-helix transcriptional regulator [Pedobacter fastidiosus]|uniref:Helix-turn-helix transcriptional regulator n=1 Tax=Pedobacter fastidiosus TaxID=2765361 RepID=A0ABR7KQF7_9SPHI|nr:helix-turn-helix domain-containing protein [Pedobacter fastidiosus]MBC6110233.1 helix-turn-helix transcriptional regulator [Pedobacter fastidiosus]
MAISIYDKSNQRYVVGDMIDPSQMNLPLVTERREKFSFPFGDAELVQIAFSGIFIIYGDVVVKEARLRVKSFDEPELVELHFSIKGDGVLENFITNKKIAIKANQHNILYTPYFDGIAQFSTDESHKFFEVHFQREKFVDLISDSSTLLKTFGDNIMNNKSVELSAENLPISLAMYSCINDIMNCSFTGGLKLLFLQSKCVELLALQAQAFVIADKKTEKPSIKSAYDKDRIHYAREYLLQNVNHPPSLTELAKIVGINEFKLKQGFKETFNNTVFGYLSDYKLMKAKELLADSAMDIKTIADELGYSSVQHFSNAFSKKFGVSPGKAR